VDESAKILLRPIIEERREQKAALVASAIVHKYAGRPERIEAGTFVEIHNVIERCRGQAYLARNRGNANIGSIERRQGGQLISKRWRQDFRHGGREAAISTAAFVRAPWSRCDTVIKRLSPRVTAD
jgi:hypothetical protein